MGNEIKRCMIIGSAPLADKTVFEEYPPESFYIICADGGVDTAKAYGLRPDLLIGDFDSLRGELPEGIETIRLKPEKDDTDMMAAVREGLRRGFREFVLAGALGGERFDHSIANLCVLQYLAEQGCHAVLADRNTSVLLLKSGRMVLRGLAGATFSAFPFGCAVCTVSYEGMKYPLDEYPLRSNFPLGCSNQIINDPAQVIVHSGDALIVIQKDA
ncbi:thiamine diphosphokinase [Clostridium sp. D33t1_170424_F3]|uniref:thiamine diphosphokinase n=1 Tax=Clostridium sp. D33t1_170424_F3 TaxID=2787099 RepID=UPI001A9B14A3|nr:thiamine diphosphokinase [Clostridium sp. D33t1_170424_F3]